MHCACHVAVLLTSGLAARRIRYTAGEAVTLGLPAGHQPNQHVTAEEGRGHADNLGLMAC